MRIDLPLCGFKNCRFSFDGNCTNKIEYDRCEYRLANGELADVELVRHGRWIDPEENDGHTEWHCSYCGDVVCTTCGYPSANYCLNCGTKMDGGKE